MALPDKRLPLIHYDTKDEYEAKVAAMTTEERAQYDAFYLGFVADTREFHTKGNTYKCGRGWVLSDITGAQAGANEFVSNVCAGDTLLMSNNELVLLMGKTLDNNIITVTALSPSGGYSLTFSTDDNGANWHLSATTPRSFVQAELMDGTSAMMAEMGGIYETEGGLVIAFPSSSQEVKDFADYTLQAEITDLENIRSGANNGNQAMEIINSRDNVAAQPYKVKYGITANGGKVSDNAASIKALRGDTAVANNFIGKDNSVPFYAQGIQGNYVNGYWVYSGTATNWAVALLPQPAWGTGIKGHKIILFAEGEHNFDVLRATAYYANSTQDFWIGEITTLLDNTADIEPVASMTIGQAYSAKLKYKLVDLTLMFGAGNEPTTVEEYYERKPIVADESAYNEGQLAGFGPEWGVKCQTADGATTSTKHFDISGIFPHGLNKVGSVRDEMYYDSARRTWVAVHRVGVVDLGTLEWTKQDRPDSIITWRFYSSELADMVPGVIYDFTCTKYKADISPVGNEDTDKTIASYYRALYVIDTSYSDAATFKAAMQGVLLCYELAEPVIEDVPFFDSFYNAYEGGTEEIVADTPTTAMDADIAYQYDDRGRIDFIYSKIKSL